jgi:hypothetical protein
MKGPIEIATGIYGIGSAGVNWYLGEDGGAAAPPKPGAARTRP